MMVELSSIGMGSVKRSQTAELRRLYDRIHLTLEDGYNHKQICAQLNSLGIEIPYAQYRVIISRLRRERSNQESTSAAQLQVTSGNLFESSAIKPLAQSALPKMNAVMADETKFTWNPGSKTKW